MYPTRTQPNRRSTPATTGVVTHIVAVGCALASVAMIGACDPGETPEHYAFVTLLGNDTISVEKIARTSSTLISDEVDRFPFVRQRHTVFDITDDGKLSRMVMDVHTPNGKTPAERARQVTADFTNDSVRIAIRDSAGVKNIAYATGGALTVPHVSMMYSMIEFEVASSLGHAASRAHTPDSGIVFRQFYPDRDIGPNFVLHRGVVYPRGPDSVELRHDWLAGTADIALDSSGRMQSYSGARTTYKVNVQRTTTLPDVEAIGAGFVAAEKARGAAQLSVRDTVRENIGMAAITIDYGRPLARGRTLLGNVIELNRVWRTGANAATQFTTTVPISLAGLSLPAATYTLWTIPRDNSVELVVNTQNGQWGTQYDGAYNLGTATMKSETVAPSVEKFTIRVTPRDTQHGDLIVEWGDFRWTAPIVVK